MEDLDREILHRAEPIEGIAALRVFGSRANGTPRPDSDLDVAVLPAVVLLDESPELLRRREEYASAHPSFLSPTSLSAGR